MIFDAVSNIPFGMKKKLIKLFAELYELDDKEEHNELFWEELCANDYLLVYTIGNKPVGCLFLNLYDYINNKFYDKGCMLLSNLYVLKEYRHQGIATALLKRAEEIAIDLDIDCISSSYSINNHNSANWHKKNGFEIIDTTVNVIKNFKES